MKTMVGLPVAVPTKFDLATIRLDLFRREGFDNDTLQEFARYVAKTSGLSYDELASKLRLRDAIQNLSSRT